MPLGDVALHLGAQDQLGLQLGDLGLDLEIVVGDQRLDAIGPGRLTHLAGELAAISAEPDHGEAQLLGRDARGGDRVAGVAEHEHALAGQVVGIDRSRVPGQPRALLGQDRRRIDAGEARDLRDERARRADADRHGPGRRLTEGAAEPARRLGRDLGIEHHVEIGLAQAREIGRARAERRHDMDVDAEPREQIEDLVHVVAMAKAQRARA